MRLLHLQLTNGECKVFPASMFLIQACSDGWGNVRLPRSHSHMETKRTSKKLNSLVNVKLTRYFATQTTTSKKDTCRDINQRVNTSGRSLTIATSSAKACQSKNTVGE